MDQSPKVKWQDAGVPEKRPIRIDIPALSIYKINIWMVIEGTNDIEYCIRSEEIVTIQPAHNIAFNTPQPLINGIGLPSVALRYKRDSIPIGCKNVNSAICATAIHDK